MYNKPWDKELDIYAVFSISTRYGNVLNVIYRYIGKQLHIFDSSSQVLFKKDTTNVVIKMKLWADIIFIIWK
jgi:hypothetical protein